VPIKLGNQTLAAMLARVVQALVEERDCWKNDGDTTVTSGASSASITR
jgi:hypothetical protein